MSVTGVICSALGLTAAYLWYKSYTAVSTPAPAAKPPVKSTPQPKPTASKPAMSQPAPNNPSIAYSNPDTVELKYPLSDEFRLKSGKRFTIAPLWDPERDTWARLTYAQTERALARLGLRMMTFDELDEVAKRPDTLILEPTGLVYNTTDQQLMATESYWDKADVKVQKKLDDAGWHGERPVKIAKTWAKKQGAAVGNDRSWLHGMYVPKGGQPGGGYLRIIQNRGKTAHDTNHIDYSQLIEAVEA